jgi:hypothetical protein
MMVSQHLDNTILGHYAPDRQTGKALQVCALELQFLVHRFQASVSVLDFVACSHTSSVKVCGPIKRCKLINVLAYWQSKLQKQSSWNNGGVSSQ